MRLALVLLVGLVILPGSPASAQEASAKETRCWVGNVAFSAGAGVNAGDGVTLCNAGGWTQAKADTPVVGCLLDGKLSSSGAIMGVRNNDDVLLQCDASGRWVRIETAAKD